MWTRHGHSVSHRRQASEAEGTREQLTPSRSTLDSNDYDPVADIYDAYVRAEFDLDFFAAEAARADGPVLELMAGTGRVSERLAGAGWDFTCVDLSREMLQVLWRKAPEWEGSARAICADVCDLPLTTRFGLVVIPFHSFAELTDPADQRSAMAEIHRVLLPGGRCICTLHNPVVRARSLTGERELRGTFDLPSGGNVMELWVEASLDAVTRIAESVQTYRILDSSGEMASERVQKVRFALIERPEFEGMARAAGFRVAQLYGDYERGEFVSDESPHMIWILEKPADGGVWG